MSRRDPKDTQAQIQALRDSAVPPYNPSVPIVSTDVPITLSAFTTSSDRRHVRSFNNASLLGAFGKGDSELPPARVDDDDEEPAPADADIYEYDSLCRDCAPLCALHIPRRTPDTVRRADWENATPSTQMFRFSVDGEVAFQGRLQSMRCIHDTAHGPCRSKAVFGAPHCWQHLLWRRHLRIKQSNHGRGLFAQRPGTSTDPVFKKNQTVIEYIGQELTMDTLKVSMDTLRRLTRESRFTAPKLPLQCEQRQQSSHHSYEEHP
jgi:hypothetical protein